MAQSTEAPEGIVISSYGGSNTGIDYRDVFGNSNDRDNVTYPNEILALSKTQLETLDLISEGLIQGLVTGEYVKTGVVGEVGWRSAIFSGYDTPLGYENTRFLKSIYWNEVPVLSQTAQFNFQNVSVTQTPGFPNGEAIQVLSPFQTVSRSIGERLRGGDAYSKIYRISNRDCRGVVVNVKVPQLYEVYVAPKEPVGAVVRTRINYSISYRAYYSNKVSADFIVAKSPSVFGKLTTANGYIKSDRIDFPVNFLNDPAFIGWEIKISRSTDDSRDSNLVNATYVDSLTEIQGNVYTFPNSALVRSLFDAEYFASVPERAYDVNLLKVKIPGNYNPILKTYSPTGFATSNSGWNGEFATGKYHTDNPAWCYYDLLTNKRYGLGKYIDSSVVDAVSLYQIGKYCDTLVSDGYGGLEPRFTCNTWFTAREEAYKVINDMASIFLGMTYYANGSIYVTQDSPKTPILTFTNANVEDGNFNYSTTSKKTRNSVAIVRYNDPKNFYRPSIEYVDDIEQIRKYGVREIELTAFGCASRGQAMRMGRWVLLSDKLEPESVNFITSIGEAAYLTPGDVFKVHDTNKKLKRYGGRTVSVRNIDNTGSQVILDSKVDVESNLEYKISFLTPSFNYNSSQVTGLNSADIDSIRRPFLQEFYFSGLQSSISGSRMVVNIYSGFDYTNYRVTGQQVWIMELSDRNANYSGNIYFTNSSEDYYRVINIEEKETNKFNVIGLQYNSQKYGEIESGLVFESQRKNEINIPMSPKNLSLNVYSETSNIKRINYGFLVDSLNNIDSFKIYAKTGAFVGNGVPSSEYLIDDLPMSRLNNSYTVSESGDYNFRIYSFNSKQSLLSAGFASGSATVYSIDPIRDIIISNLTLASSTGLNTGSVANTMVSIIRDNDANPEFTWSVGSENPFATTGNYKYMVTVRARPNNSRVPTANVAYRESGLVIPSWQYTLAKNISSSGGPYRDFQVVVEAYTPNGKTSAGNQIGSAEAGQWSVYPNGYDIIQISNPRQTGIELSDNLPTEAYEGAGFSGITGNYRSYQYLGPNGNVSVEFTSGAFDADLVGGYLYISSGRFPKREAALDTGPWGSGIKKVRFEFDPNSPYFTHPNAAIEIRGATKGYGSISFYDEIDKALIDRGVNVSTGLYISNNAVFPASATVSKLGLSAAYLYSVRIPNSNSDLTIASSEVTQAIPTNGAAIAVSNNALAGWSAVFYMGPPLTGSPYTGIYKGDSDIS